jgi:hypothetical protein
MGPRAGLDVTEKRKFSPLLGTEFWSSSPYPTAILTELSQLSAFMFYFETLFFYVI